MIWTARILSILTTIALFLPVFSGYMMALVMLIAQLLPSWRHSSNPTNTAPTSIWSIPIATLLLAISVLAGISAMGAGPDASNEALHYWGNALVKYGLLWFFMRGYIARAVAEFDFGRYVSRALGPVSFFHLLYCCIQRQTGIDWAHGFGTVLPENRFAYGVYRVSGFSSHPLTIGYQLCFITILGLSLGFLFKTDRIAQRSAFLGGICAGLTILISGSRGPQIVLVAILASLFVWRLSKAVWKWIPVGAVAAFLAVWKLGILARFAEVNTTGSGDSRTIDWKVHTAAFLDHPILGLGPAGFKTKIAQYYAATGAEVGIGLAHNFYLQILAEMGVVGFCAYAFWISTWPRFSLRFFNWKDRSILLTVFIAMILSAITQNSLRDSGVLFDVTFVTMVLAAVLLKTCPAKIS